MPYLRHPALAGALLAALAIAAALPPPAAAQIRRCTSPDGGAVYTDRSCESGGAVENRPRTDGPAHAAALRYRGGCSRRLQELVFEVTAAIDAGDTNRLARSYHWVGMSTRNGYAVIERLDAIARRPLLNISALRPMQAVVAMADPVPLAAPDGQAVMPATPPAPRRPVALRIDQALADGITPSSTTFGLRRHMDCWWITL
jgi:hypothetical protein